MGMRIKLTDNDKVVLDTRMTLEDFDSVKDVNKILKDMSIIVNPNDILYNPLTGEIISMDEIPRVMGILSCIFESLGKFEIKRG